MPRTTLNLDAQVLRDLKLRGAREGKTLGELASELITLGLRERREGAPPRFEWKTQQMRARMDLEDKETLRAALESR